MANLSPKGALTLDDMLHLGRRAGFGLTPEQAQAFLTDHASAPVDDWVDGTNIDRSAFTNMLPTADPVKEDEAFHGPSTPVGPQVFSSHSQSAAVKVTPGVSQSISSIRYSTVPST